MELWLVRHGQTTWNADGRITGWTDVPLTPLGEEQARAVRPLLDTVGPFDSVRCSDLLRARQTAALAWGEVTAEPDERLRELNFGELEGVVWQKTPDRERKSLMRFDRFRAPGGEDYETFRARVVGFIEELDDGRHLLFVHAGVIRLVLFLLGADRFLPPASVAGVDWTAHEVLGIYEGGVVRDSSSSGST